MTEDDLLDELAAIRLRFSKQIDETLGRLAAWIEELPDAEPEEAERTPEAREALRLVDAEIRAVAALLTEVLPALVQKTLQNRA